MISIGRDIMASESKMIPKFSESGVLPPFLPGSDPTVPADVAPYRISLSDLVATFGTTPERKKILVGYLNYRVELKSKGIVAGFQWIDGSFTENAELTRGRPPGDIDILTFAVRPASASDLDSWVLFVNTNLHLFDPGIAKQAFSCDAYYVDLSIPPQFVVSKTAYWFGLFSHQRETFLWKGLLEISLDDTDEEKLLELLVEELESA
jgi:hypothetical protein